MLISTWCDGWVKFLFKALMTRGILKALNQIWNRRVPKILIPMENLQMGILRLKKELLPVVGKLLTSSMAV